MSEKQSSPRLSYAVAFDHVTSNVAACLISARPWLQAPRAFRLGCALGAAATASHASGVRCSPGFHRSTPSLERRAFGLEFAMIGARTRRHHEVSVTARALGGITRRVYPATAGDRPAWRRTAVRRVTVVALAPQAGQAPRRPQTPPSMLATTARYRRVSGRAGS